MHNRRAGHRAQTQSKSPCTALSFSIMTKPPSWFGAEAQSCGPEWAGRGRGTAGTALPCARPPPLGSSNRLRRDPLARARFPGKHGDLNFVSKKKMI